MTGPAITTTIDLAIRPERIDPRYLTGGQPPPVIARRMARREPVGRASYEVDLPQGEAAAVDLWGGEADGDPRRLRDAVESLLAPPLDPEERP